MIDTNDASRPLCTTLAACAALLLGASCVSRASYDEAQAEVRYYQRAYQDLESFQGKLEAENAQLRGEVALFEEASTIEASATAPIDERLEELRALAEAIGAAPGDVTVLAVEGGYGLRLRDAVLFDSGSAEIKPEGRTVLEKMVVEITSRPFERIWVRGHSDSDPVVRPETLELFPQGNLQLSVARALEVAAVLTAEGGVPRERVVVAGFGPSDPVVPNTSAEEKRRNRRVEIFVIEDGEAGSAH